MTPSTGLTASDGAVVGSEVADDFEIDDFEIDDFEIDDFEIDDADFGFGTMVMPPLVSSTRPVVRLLTRP